MSTNEETAPLFPYSRKSKAVTLDQRYEVIKKIDEGTYAKVYLAQDWHKNGKQVVLKILRPRCFNKSSDRAQVKKEIDNHSRLDHPNILKMFEHSFNGVMNVKGLVDA